MDLTIYKARYYLYWFFLFWAILLFALSVARLSYTEHIPKGDPLNGGKDFFDPSVVALLVSALLGLIFAPFMLYTLYTQFIHRYLAILSFELAAAALLWVLWLGSAAAATNVWPDLSFCVQFRACTNLQAVLAFAWLGWISLTILILITIVSAVRQNAWREYSHGPWADRPLIWHDGLRMPSPEYANNGGGSQGPPMRVVEEV